MGSVWSQKSFRPLASGCFVSWKPPAKSCRASGQRPWEGDPLREKAKGEQCPVSVPPGSVTGCL